MRVGLFLLPLSFCAAPALAQTAPAPAASTEARPQLVDPAAIDKLADGMQALSKALLDMRVGELRAALEGRNATAAEKKLTVRDLARRDDPAFEEHLQQQIAQARPRMERSIKALNKALPEVTEDLQRAQKSIERAIANLPDPNYPNR